MPDSLKTYEPKETGLFIKVKEGEPVTLRVLTLDPLVSIDKWGNTRYSFVVWNWKEDRPQVLSKGSGILKQLVAIHRDEDLDPLDELDIKITATGEGLETRYAIIPMPKAKVMTAEMTEKAKEVDLTKVIENGVRLSQYEDDTFETTIDVDDPPPEESPLDWIKE